MEPRTGPKIERFLRESSGLVVVVAPYVTRRAFQHMLDMLDGRPLVTVTDWNIHAVASGATDPRIFHDVTARQAPTELKLLPSLHGKLYWTRAAALVGSTNLTANGTSWFGRGNLELLVTVEPHDADVEAFLEAVRRYAYEATATDMDAAVAAAKAIDVPVRQPPGVEEHPMLWSFADDFFEEYEFGELFSTEALTDAATLRVPPALTRHQLVRHLRAQLLALPYFRLAERVSELTGSSNAVGAQRDALVEFADAYGIATPETPEEADRFWEVLMDWMRTIFPDQFTMRVTGPTVLARTAGHF